MTRTDNYQIQVRQARDRFLTYDQEALIQKMGLGHDGSFLYVTMLSRPYRISRTTGGFEALVDGRWIPADSHGEVMTLLDLICDSRPDRHIRGRWKAMTAFGHMFHQDLAENRRDPWAQRFQADPEGFGRACRALGGRPFPQGDSAWILELFEGVPVVLQLWFGDEEFPASLRLLWDENALMYLKYETMWYAKGLLLERLAEHMAHADDA